MQSVVDITRALGAAYELGFRLEAENIDAIHLSASTGKGQTFKLRDSPIPQVVIGFQDPVRQSHGFDSLPKYLC